MRYRGIPVLGAVAFAALNLVPTGAWAASDAEIAALRAQIKALEARLDGVQREAKATARTAASARNEALNAQARAVPAVKDARSCRPIPSCGCRTTARPSAPPTASSASR